jgi:hypothetical protein
MISEALWWILCDCVKGNYCAVTTLTAGRETMTRQWIPKKTMSDAALAKRREHVYDKLQAQLDAKAAARRAKWDAMTEEEKDAAARRAIAELWPG